ncbi:GNAT family N-acetyltransferase [Paenibacillus motobuensis]|uniref:N-acetyltransferase n=1 Tax=Paenibacillus motobuensis TaxID=295324 RepID=A0ABP3IEM6_9BACL
MATLIAIEPMQAKYNAQVSRLLVYGFGDKFRTLMNMGDDELALLFEHLLEHFPSEPASQRLVALQEGEVIGTLGFKRKPDHTVKQEQKQRALSWKSFNKVSKWSLIKLLTGLYLLDHRPQVGECYVTDIAVHPDYRGQGVGKLLLQRVQHFVQTEPNLYILSLYVAGKNPRAKHLYEQLSFRTHFQGTSIIRQLFFKEPKWDYMQMKFDQ